MKTFFWHSIIVNIFLFATIQLSAQSGPTVLTSQLQRGSSPCPPNIDFEYGNFTNWNCFLGDVSRSGVITVSSSLPTFSRHTLISRTTPSAKDKYGSFPINPPDGSGHAIKLGNDQIGAEAERLRYIIHVPVNAKDFSITFQYAVVLENPNHQDYEEPRFTSQMQDSATGAILQCASFTYVASLVPGFLTSPVLGTGGALVKFKPWSSVYVNLSKYAGQTLFFDLTTVDCTQGGHFGYAYVDVVECGIGAKAQNNCMAPSTTTLSGPPGFQTYTWYDQDFTKVGVKQDVTLSPGSALGSTFYVVVEPYNNTDCPTCDCRDTIGVQVTADMPVAAFGIQQPVQCLNGNQFAFVNQSTVTGPSNTYMWDFGDGTIVTTNSDPSHTYTAMGTYRIKLTVVGGNGCEDTLSHSVIVHPNPDIILSDGPDAILCRDASKQLFVSGAINYSWSPASDLSCTNCSSPVASPLSTITYRVNGVNSFGCADEDTIRITVIQPFKVKVNSDTICVSQSVVLEASGANSYLWSPATGLSNTTIATPTANPTQTTIYRIIGFDAYNCFTDIAFAKLTVGRYPTINLGPDMVSSTGSSVTLASTTTNGPIVKWVWTPGSYLSCSTCPDPVADIKKDITYKVTVTNNYGCSATDNISIKTTCDNGQVFIANAFTPDGDGVNDFFMIQGKGIGVVKSLRIFNRWGELLFEKYNALPNNPAYGWDGKIRGAIGPPDVFVYTAEVVCTNGSVFSYKGNVTLLR